MASCNCGIEALMFGSLIMLASDVVASRPNAVNSSGTF